MRHRPLPSRLLYMMSLTQKLTFVQLRIEPLLANRPQFPDRELFKSPVNMIKFKLFRAAANDTAPAENLNGFLTATVVPVKLVLSLVLIVSSNITPHAIIVAEFC